MATYLFYFVIFFCFVLKASLMNLLYDISNIRYFNSKKCDFSNMETLSIYKNISTRSKIECATRCSIVSKCKSFDFCVCNGYNLCRLREVSVNCMNNGLTSYTCFNYEKAYLVDDPVVEMTSDAITTTSDAITTTISDAITTTTSDAITTTTTLATTTESNPCQNGGIYNSFTGTCTCQLGCSGTYCALCYADCLEGKNGFQTGIKVSYLKPAGALKAFQTLCNFDVGVTYIQYRKFGNVNFNRSWIEYKDGFGDLNGDFWLGNKNIHALLSQKSYTATFRVYFSGSWSFNSYAAFETRDESYQYRINYDETYYAISIDGLSPSDSNKEAKGRSFSTYDNDPTGCARTRGSGWWFNSGCSASNINGPFPVTWGTVNTVSKTAIGLQ